jgi:hypothetical protein
VQEPVFRSNLAGQTGWFAAPVVADLDGDGSNELIAAYYDLSVYDANAQKVADIVGGEGQSMRRTWWRTWKGTAKRKSSMAVGLTSTLMSGWAARRS